MNPSDQLTFERIELQLQKVATSAAIAPAVVYDLKPEVAADMASGNLIASLRGYVLSDHLATDQTVEFADRPASWWQHAKAELFPTFSRWLRRPPRYVRERVTITVDSFATFPESNISYPPDLGRTGRLQVLRMDRVECPRDDDQPSR